MIHGREIEFIVIWKNQPKADLRLLESMNLKKINLEQIENPKTPFKNRSVTTL